MTAAGDFQFGDAVFHYTRFGNGTEVMLAFHGFSESGTSFLPLEPALGLRYTIYAFDLPWHGETQWPEGRIFTPADLLGLVRGFLDYLGASKFAVLGFSMGGKCALYITKHMPDRLNALWLLASDGIQTNRIYNVAVYPAWGRKLFKTTIRHPSWFFGMVNLATRLRLITPWLKKFTNNHMATREKRQRLYDTWISMAGFNPDIELVKKQLNTFHIPALLFFGRRDEVIPYTVGEQFAEGVALAKLTVLERGHYFIDEKINPMLEEAMHFI
ncbi:MAG TPA: alpha/beta hydrolase [Chitinophagales bacterium]|nr:alpha/beta hydrolase [Chitinophagales bacterium]